MVDTKLMFGLEKLPGKGPYLSAITAAGDPNKVNVALGMPCIISKAAWESKRSSEIRLLFTFPKDKGHSINEIYATKKQNVIAVDDQPFTNNHKIKMVPRFDWSKVEAIQQYVEANGSLTIHISNYSADCGGEIMGIVMGKFFDGIADNLLNKYKYNSVEHHVCDDSYKALASTDLAYYVTFISLPNCIPIFNRKKVHGMGMIYRAVKYRHSISSRMMSCPAQLAVILTDYPDNKYIIDGIAVGFVDPVHSDTIKRMRKLALVNSKVKAKKGKHQKAKKDPFSCWGEITEKYATSQATVHFGSSSTTTYYSNTA